MEDGDPLSFGLASTSVPVKKVPSVSSRSRSDS